MAASPATHELGGVWLSAITRDSEAAEGRALDDPADLLDAAPDSAAAMQDAPQLYGRASAAPAPASTFRLQQLGAIDAATQAHYHGRHKRLPMVPRGCQGVATTLALLSKDSGAPVEFKYSLCGRLQCVDRCRMRCCDMQDVEAAVLAKGMPFVSIKDPKDVTDKKILHGVFRREFYIKALNDDKAILFEFEGPVPKQGVLLVIAPGWKPAADLAAAEAPLDPSWTYVGDADLKDEVENIKLWPSSCRSTTQNLLEKKRDKKPLAETNGADISERARFALAVPSSKRVVRTTKKGEPHLVDLKLGLFLPVMAKLLREDPADVANGPGHLVVGGHVEVDAGTDEKWGVAIAGVGKGMSSERALSALVPCDLGPRGELMPQKNAYGVRYASSVFDPKAFDKDTFHALFNIALAAGTSLEGLVAAVYSWSGILDNETAMVVRGALTLSRPESAPVTVRDVFKTTEPILAMRMCARPAALDSSWSLEMLPDYSPPSKPFDSATLKTDYPELVKVLRAPAVEPLLAAENDHAAAANLIASASGNSISKRVAKALIKQIAAELPSERQQEHLAQTSCAATVASMLQAIEDEQARRRDAVVAKRQTPLIGGVGSRFGKSRR